MFELLFISLDLVFNLFKCFSVNFHNLNLKFSNIFLRIEFSSEFLLSWSICINTRFLNNLLYHLSIKRVWNLFLEFLREISIIHLNKIIINSNHFIDKLNLLLEIIIESRTIPNTDEEENCNHQEISCCVDNHQRVEIDRIRADNNVKFTIDGNTNKTNEYVIES